MIFIDTAIAGVVIIELDQHVDERGSFARSFSRNEFAAHGLFPEVFDANISHNTAAFTLRGMHLQAPPKPDPKLVRCTAGSMFDVAVDLRPGSPTYLSWVGTTLTAAEGNALHIPGGCAHGFVTLEPSTTVHYLMGELYYPDLARGYRWDDPAFAIDWPVQPVVVSDRDAGYGDYRPELAPEVAGGGK